VDTSSALSLGSIGNTPRGFAPASVLAQQYGAEGGDVAFGAVYEHKDCFGKPRFVGR
jgi:hypothetical protein